MSLTELAVPTTPWPGAPAPAVEAWHGRVPLRLPRWGLGDVWIALGGAVVASTVVGLLAFTVPGVPAWQSAVVLIALVAQWIPMLGWPLVATARKGNGPRLDLGAVWKRSDLAWGIGGGLAVLACAALIGAATQAVHGEFTSAAGELLDQFRGQQVQLILLAVAVGIGAPIVEEVCFRGLFWGALAKRGMSVWWATALTAAAFSVFHLEPVRIPMLLVTGLLLGYLRQRTGRLGASVVAHMINNLTGVLTLFLPV